MAEVEVTESVKRRRCADVSLPLYRKHVIDSDHHPDTTIYMRVEQHEHGFREVSITFRPPDYGWPEQAGDRHVEIEIEHYRHFPNSDTAEYALGQGEYACTAEEFNTALAEAQRIFETIKQ